MIAKAGEAQKHISNEWADELCNAYVTMQNIKDGITTFEDGLAYVKSGIDRCRTLPTITLDDLKGGA